MPDGAWSTRVRPGIAAVAGWRGVRAAVVIAAVTLLLSGAPAALASAGPASTPRESRLHPTSLHAGQPRDVLEGLHAQQKPTPEDDIPDVSLTLGGASHTVDVAGYFSDSMHSYEVTASPNGIVRTSRSGTVITIEPLAVGSATVTVRGRRVGGSERKRFNVTVSAMVAAPTTTGSIAAVTLTEGDTHAVTASDYFEGEGVTYAAASSDTAVATVDVDGAEVTVTAVGAGNATITVTATNSGGSAQQAFAVTVQLPAVTLTRGDTRTLELSDHFGDGVTGYDSSISPAGIVELDLAGSQLTLTALADGTATITLGVTTARGTAEHRFRVTVVPPAPSAVGSIAAVTITEGDTHATDASNYFSGEGINYTAGSSNAAVAAVAVEGTTVTVTAVAAGESTVTVTATNAGGSASQSFAVAVELPSITLTEGDTRTIELADYFGADVTGYEVTVSPSGIVHVSRSGSALTLSGIASGEATVTVTATSAGESAEQSFAVTVSAVVSAPTTVGSIAAATIIEGGTHAEDASAHFEGEGLTYAAESSATEVATVEVAGASVTVRAVAAGKSTVTVTATNGGGSAQQSFTVTVSAAVSAPSAVGSIERATLTEGTTHTVTASDHFEGEGVTYSAESSDTAVATVGVAGSSVTVTAVAAGEATVTVTATNAGGSAQRSLAVTVLPPAPTAVGSVEGATHTVTASDHFEGEGVTYSAESSDTAVATVGVAGASVTVTAVAAGESTVTVTATNAGGSAEQSFAVTVVPPAPVAEGQIADPALHENGGAVEVDLAAYFSGAVERYEVAAEPAGIVHVWESDGRLALTPLASGVATATVTATNAGGVARQAFLVSVRDGAPSALGRVPLVQIIEGDYSFVDAAAHFDGDDLTLVAESSSPHVVAVEAHGGTVVVRALAVGVGLVTVTATNGAGSATQEIVVVVTRRAPRVTGEFADVTLTAGTAARTIDLSHYFLGGSARYGASAEPGGVVHLWESEGRLTLTPLAAGSTTITVWSANSGGMASQTFEVAVERSAPRSLGSRTLLTLSMGGLPPTIELADYFAGAVDRYELVVTPGGIVHPWESGGMLTLTPLAAGLARLDVTALNAGGSAGQAFTVVVQPAAPRALGRIVGAPLSAGGVGQQIALADYFVGDVTHFEVESRPDGVLHLWESRGRLRLTPLSPGVATVTVTASNGSGSAGQAFAVAVGPAAPQVLADIERIALAEGGPARDIDLGNYFGGEGARYHLSADPGGVVHGWESGGRLTLTPLAAGVATVGVTATNSAGSTEQRFVVEVAAAAPAPLGGVEGVMLIEGGDAREFDLADLFSSAVARYQVSADPVGVVHAWLSEGRLRLTPLAAGSATVAVTASNEGGSARQEIAVVVR